MPRRQRTPSNTTSADPLKLIEVYRRLDAAGRRQFLEAVAGIAPREDSQCWASVAEVMRDFGYSKSWVSKLAKAESWLTNGEKHKKYRIHKASLILHFVESVFKGLKKAKRVASGIEDKNLRLETLNLLNRVGRHVLESGAREAWGEYVLELRALLNQQVVS